MKKIKTIPALVLLFLFTHCVSPANTKRATELNTLGIQYLQERKEKEAISSFLEASQVRGITDAQKTEFLRNIGVSYLQALMKDSAKYYYLQAAKLNEETSYPYLVNIADVYIIDDNVYKAIDCLEQAWDIDSNRLAANNLLGIIYLGENDKKYADPAKALKYNIKADQINASRNTKFVLAKNYYYLKDYENAEGLFRDLHAQYPTFSDYLTTLIMVEEKEGKSEQAKTDLAELRQTSPASYRAYIKSKQIEK